LVKYKAPVRLARPLFSFLLLCSSLASAHPNGDQPPIEVEVKGEAPKPVDGAGHLELSRRELLLRPSRAPGDLLEAVPGLVVVQHAGGGKANQYFLRGFDADHGTDVALFLNGVPLNERSHGHGQGYADFNFVIPELIGSLTVHKGPNDARFGDFATAGAVEVKYVEHLPDDLVAVEYGQFGHRRAVAAVSPHLGGDFTSLLAVELAASQGPFQVAEDLQKLNLVAGVSHKLGDHGGFSARLMSYGATWNGSGQLPLRAVCGEGEPGFASPSSFGQPCLDRFASVDPTEGGRTQRQSAEASFWVREHDVEVDAHVFGVRYQFGLFSDFTFFANDPERGDGIEQTDERVTLGGTVRLKTERKLGSVRLRSTFGLEARTDDVDNALYHQQARQRLATVNASHVVESSTAAFLEERAILTPWLSTMAAVRVERFQASVEPRHDAQQAGTAHAMLPLPKFGLELTPTAGLSLFGNYGRGFHSNDARSTVSGNASLMAPALGYEAGLRYKPRPDVQVYATAFLLDLESELVWVGDEGTTEASPQSRRKGLELGSRAHFNGWLFADVDLTLSHARFITGDAANRVPLAPRATLSAGLAAHPRFGDYQPFGAYRIRAIADRPANEDASLVAKGYVVQDVSAGLRYRDIEAAIDVMNVFDVAWRPVNFATTSRLDYEPTPVTSVHFVPGWPRTFIGRATLYWD
jgi:outer membrane receptor protein involved in Fe transport